MGLPLLIASFLQSFKGRGSASAKKIAKITSRGTPPDQTAYISSCADSRQRRIHRWESNRHVPCLVRGLPSLEDDVSYACFEENGQKRSETVKNGQKRSTRTRTVEQDFPTVKPGGNDASFLCSSLQKSLANHGDRAIT